MSKKVLPLALLLALGLVGCAQTEASDSNVNTSTKEETTTSETTTKVEEPEATPTGELVMTGTFKKFGGGKVDLYLQEGNKAHFNVTCDGAIPGLSLIATNKMFDRTWTYAATPGTNVYEFSASWQKTDMTGKPVGDPVKKTYTSVYNAETKKSTLEYVLVGQEDILVEMEGTLPEVAYMSGKFEKRGGGKVELFLREGNKAFFDATFNQTIPGVPQEQMNKMFDRTWDYTVEKNVYTFTGIWDKMSAETHQPTGEKETLTYVSVVDDKKGITTLEYVMSGEEKIIAKLVGTLPMVGDPVMTGSAKDFGGIDVALHLIGNNIGFFDVTCKQVIPGMTVAQMSTMFDKYAKYTVAEGVYTFTIEWPTFDPTTHQPGQPQPMTYISVKGEDGKSTLDYVMKGQRDIVVAMTGTLPA